MGYRAYVRRASWIAGVLAALSIVSGAFAQETVEQRLDRLEKANADLQRQVSQQQQIIQQQAVPPQSSGASLSPAIEPVAAQMPQAPSGAAGGAPVSGPPPGQTKDWYEIGSDLRMTASWKDGFLVQTANKDFWTHIGGWLQWDNYAFNQNNGLHTPRSGTAPAAPFAGPNQGGIGELEDGSYFRRLRIQFEGGFSEVFQYNLVFKLEDSEFSQTGLDEFWVGMAKVPVLGYVRVGNVKIAEGLEGDSYSSSKAITFEEKASFTEAFYQNFGDGIWIANNLLDHRAFWAFNAYRQEDGSSGINFGDGEYAFGGRIAALPLWSNDGRCFLHLASSYYWRKAQDTNTNAPGDGANTPGVEFRARPEMRDDSPGAGGAQAVPLGNTNRMVDTGVLPASSSGVLGVEAFGNYGPLSIIGEWAWATAFDVNGKTGNAKFTGQDFTFSGGYAQVGYFLTGESRSYDREFGRLGSSYIEGGPRTPFWFTRAADGSWDHGIGAWELAARASYLDLNDGVVNGGTLLGVSAGVHWFLTSNLKVQFDYQWNRRESLPVGVIPGDLNGFATRVQLVW
jgi:phosphate-selective porin OprO and OprP